MRREEYLQRLARLSETEQELQKLKALRDRLEAALRGQHPSPQEWRELQQRVRRLQPSNTQRPASDPVVDNRRAGIEPQHVRRDRLMRRIQRGRSRSVSHPDGINLMCEFERLEDRLRVARTDAELTAVELKLGELESRAGFATS